MGWHFQSNLTPATGSVATYSLMQAMIAAGWVVKSSSDGTTYNSSGNQITSGNSGANGLANTQAWFRIQDPGTLREFIMQRGTTNQAWRVKYSQSAKFTGGSPSATVSPTASDQTLLIGGGTDASPSFGNWYNADGGYRYTAAANDTAVVGANNINGYGVYHFAFPTGGGLPTSAFLCDPMNHSLNSTFDSSDTDPYIVYLNGANGSSTWGGDLQGALSLTGAVKGGAASLQVKGIAPPATYNNTPFTTDPNTGFDIGFVPFYYVPSVYAKGWGSVFVWETMNRGGTSSSGGGTPTPLGTGNPFIVIAEVILPWDGSTPTV